MLLSSKRKVCYFSNQESLEWNQEFANANHSWSSEFASQGQMVQKESGDISQTAAVLLDSVKNVTNPKFAKSKFFGLMKKFKDVEAVIEGDQIVDPTSLEKGKGSFEWAKQFSSAINTGNWEESIPDSQDPSWIQQLNVGHPSSINHQLHGDQGSSAWLNEFESQSNLMPQEDWAQSFKEKLNIDPDQDDVAWNNMEKAWEYQGMHQYSADNDIRFSEYNFTANNPYQNYDQYFLTDLKQHESLTESVLALEAAVQKDNLSSALWCELGKKNQENENDAAAISALRKAIQIDPSNLNALLSLSVSYTNENYSSEAYDTLRTWIHTHPSYSHLAPFYNSVISVSEKHDLITSSFMQAAKSNPGQNLDEDVQSALGILFNISTEYTKAIDCFRAAISKRPDDYQLWNKLGATLANSNDPEQAIDSYFNALQINPDYIRARYNLAIACIQIGKYREAGEHLLGALSIQQNDLQHVQAKTNTAVPTNTTESGQSSSLWNTLRLLMETYIRRDDLISACNARDLDAFRKDFQF